MKPAVGAIALGLKRVRATIQHLERLQARCAQFVKTLRERRRVARAYR